MPKRRVVHLTNDFRINATGITEFVRTLAVAQASAGDEVAVLCMRSDGRMTGLMGDRSVTVHAREGASDSRSVGREAVRLLARADAIHVHTVKAFARAFAATPLRTWRRSIATVHNPYSNSSRVLGLAQCTVRLASAARPAFPSRGRSMHIPNPIVRPLIPDGDSGAKATLPDLAVLYVGGFSRRKGTDVLLDAWSLVVRSVPSATLHLVGNRDAPEFEDRAAAPDLAGSVAFHGVRADPEPFLRAATVFVLPSLREGFPLVLPQAREAGLPIVASAVDGSIDALDGGAAGVLVPPGDVDTLAAALIRLLQDGAERDRLARAARQGIGRLSVEAVLAQYYRAYDAVR